MTSTSSSTSDADSDDWYLWLLLLIVLLPIPLLWASWLWHQNRRADPLETLFVDYAYDPLPQQMALRDEDPVTFVTPPLQHLNPETPPSGVLYPATPPSGVLDPATPPFEAIA